jgi:hypothetical protein
VVEVPLLPLRIVLEPSLLLLGRVLPLFPAPLLALLAALISR